MTGSTGNPGSPAGRLNDPATFLTAIQFALVATISFTLAHLISPYIPCSTEESAMIGSLWAMISSILVTQDTRSLTIRTAWLQIFGAFLGAVFSAAYLTLFSFSIAGMGLVIGLVVFACILLGFPGHIRLAAFNVGIVMVISAINPTIPPDINAATRFTEVLIGSTVAVAVAWTWQDVLHIT